MCAFDNFKVSGSVQWGLGLKQVTVQDLWLSVSAVQARLVAIRNSSRNKIIINNGNCICKSSQGLSSR